MHARIAIVTLGCKANWVDSESMAQALARAGFEIVPVEAEAEAYIINTCTVTAVADQQSRQMIRRVRRAHPQALVVATGCLGEVDIEQVEAISGIDIVFGTSNREAMLTYLVEAFVLDGHHLPQLKSPTEPQSRARAFLKIQDGCNRACAYCIIPRARGKSRSFPMSEIVADCREISRHHHEIVLTGIDIGQYGERIGPGLVDLLTALVNEPGCARIRLSSLGPKRIDEELVELMAASQGRICRHVHLSIQSGSDAVLTAMARGYATDDIVRAVERLMKAIPHIAITGDAIAGFPGETEAHHHETMALIDRLPLSGLHVFPYSERPGTRAAQMEGFVPVTMRRARAKDLRGLAQAKREAFLATLVGVSLKAIVVSRSADESGMVEAITDNGVSLRVPEGRVAYADIGRVTVTHTEGEMVFGQWV